MSRRLSLLEALGLWLPVAVWAGFIFYLSSIPYLRITEGPWDYVLRKLAHMAFFGILARLLARAFRRSADWPPRRVLTAALVMTVLYACTDEVHQHYVQGRHGSPVDVAIDGLGAWAALGLLP